MKVTNTQPITLTQKLIVILLSILPLSYYPLLQLGKVAGLNVDISFIYIVSLLCVAVSAPMLLRIIPTLLNYRSIVLLLLFTLYNYLSLLWTANFTRGLATTLFLTLLISLSLLFASSLDFLKDHKRLILRCTLVSYGLLFLWCMWQLFADAIWGTGLSLLPAAYQSAVFGVARITGFALEPQFLASLLLIPFTWSLHRLLSPKPSLILERLIFSSSALLLLLTLSRGGLLAAGIIFITLLVIMRPSFRRFSMVAISGLIAIVATLALQYILGSLNTRDSISGLQTIQNSISQLSLGTLSFAAPAQPSQTSPLPAGDGYVSSSTTSRLSMSAEAFTLWSNTPLNILFGVGTGGFGASLHQNDTSIPVGSVANNYYLEMLSELGVIGMLLFVAFVITTLTYLVRQKSWLLSSLLIGLLTQWLFFSGNANVIHIWIVFGIALGTQFLTSNPKQLNS